MSRVNNNLKNKDYKLERPKSYLWDEFLKLKKKNEAEVSARNSESEVQLNKTVTPSRNSEVQVNNDGIIPESRYYPETTPLSSGGIGGSVDCVDSEIFEDSVKQSVPESHVQIEEKSLTQTSNIPESTQTTRNTGSFENSGVVSGYYQNSGITSSGDEIVVKDKNVGTKVYIRIEKIGEKVRAKFDTVFVTSVLKLTFRYNNKTWDCNTEVIPVEDGLAITGCGEAISQVVRATSRHPSEIEIIRAVNDEVSKRYSFTSEPLVEYVKRKYPEELKRIESDPFGWILTKTQEIRGYERLKLLTFLAVVSSRLKRVMGISRIHVNVVGLTGAGKTSAVKSVLKFVDDEIKFDATRFTEKALGYLDIDSFDGKIVFLEQIDGQNIQYLREALSEEKICTYVTVKVSSRSGETFKTMRKCIPGQPVFITTSVAQGVDLEKEQVANRMIHSYLKYEYNREVISSIVERTEFEVSEVDKLVFMAYLLTRPNMADLRPLKPYILAFTDELARVTNYPLNRTAEILRNLIRTVAIARGKTVADISDYNFVMQYFELDIYFSGLGLTERDVEFLMLLYDEKGGLKSNEIAERLRYPKQYTINIMRNLERKGLVEGVEEDGKTVTWSLTQLGEKVVSLIYGRLGYTPMSKHEIDKILDDNEALLSEFIDYVKANDGQTKTFAQIIEDFGDKEKANLFVNWCIKSNLCSGVEQLTIQADFRP